MINKILMLTCLLVCKTIHASEFLNTKDYDRLKELTEQLICVNSSMSERDLWVDLAIHGNLSSYSFNNNTLYSNAFTVVGNIQLPTPSTSIRSLNNVNILTALHFLGAFHSQTPLNADETVNILCLAASFDNIHVIEYFETIYQYDKKNLLFKLNKSSDFFLKVLRAGIGHSEVVKYLLEKHTCYGTKLSNFINTQEEREEFYYELFSLLVTTPYHTEIKYLLPNILEHCNYNTKQKVLIRFTKYCDDDIWNYYLKNNTTITSYLIELIKNLIIKNSSSPIVQQRIQQLATLDLNPSNH